MGAVVVNGCISGVNKEKSHQILSNSGHLQSDLLFS